jgi:hypothetical protein
MRASGAMPQGRRVLPGSRCRHRGTNSTLCDSISLPQLVFLPSTAIVGSAAIFVALENERVVAAALAE